MNTSNNFSKILSVCEWFYNSSWSSFIQEKHDNGFLIESAILDLIAGIVLSGCAFQLYRGVEISHPVYTVLFSNILFCAVSSFISFIAMLYSYIGQFKMQLVQSNINCMRHNKIGPSFKFYHPELISLL